MEEQVIYLTNVDDSAFIRWKTCSPDIARVVLEFEDCLDRNEIFAESSAKHHEDSQPFYERFSSDVNRLIKCITTHLCKITSLNVTTKNHCSRVYENCDQ